MEIESLNCNRCGAPLEVAASANFVTCHHCSAQLKIQRTESSSFTEQLGQLESNQGRMLEKLDRLERESELARLDRSWESEREQFMITNKRGAKSLPTGTAGIAATIMAVIFGIFWTIVAFSMFPPMGFFGLLFIGVGVFNLLQLKNKAQDYRAAEKRYQRRRSEIGKEQ